MIYLQVDEITESVSRDRRQFVSFQNKDRQERRGMKLKSTQLCYLEIGQHELLLIEIR